MEHWTLDPWPFVEGTVLEAVVEDEADAGLFHVTPWAEQIRAAGAMRSRRAGGVVVLGGGYINAAPDMISLHVSWSRALWMAAGVRTVAGVARGTVSYSRGVAQVLATASFLEPGVGYRDAQLDEAWEAAEVGASNALLEDLEDLAAVVGVPSAAENLPTLDDWLRAIGAESANLDRVGPAEAYARIQDVETRIVSTFFDQSAEEYTDFPNPVPVVGFTAPWSVFRHVNPAAIRILQLAGCVDCAPQDIHPPELELRLRPEAVRVAAFDAEHQRFIIEREA